MSLNEDNPSSSDLPVTDASKSFNLACADCVFFSTWPIDCGAFSTVFSVNSSTGSVWVAKLRSLADGFYSFNNSWFGLIHWFPYFFLRFIDVNLARSTKFSRPDLLPLINCKLRVFSYSERFWSWVTAKSFKAIYGKVNDFLKASTVCTSMFGALYPTWVKSLLSLISPWRKMAW